MTEQMDLFNIFNLPQIEEEKVEVIEEVEVKEENEPVKLYVGDKVRLDTKQVDNDDMLYFEYYKPKTLDNIGTVLEVENNLIFVDFKGDRVLLKLNELIVVG